MRTWKTKKEFKKLFIEKAEVLFEKNVKELSHREVYQIIATMIKDLVSDDWIQTEKIYNHKRVRQVYYFSIEFLLGRLLNTNLLNCDMEELCRSALQDFGFDLEDIFPEEPDPGLGNGGLGRLAACYIDSMAALQLPGHGCSIRYQYGLFDQRIIDGQQVELPDAWLRNGFPWEIKKSDKAVDVRFGGHAYMRPGKGGALVCVHEQYNTVRAVPYDVPVLGYQNRTVNTLRLWKAEYTRENMYGAGLQSIMRHYKKHYGSPKLFDRYIALHINDTHPALIIPELMRILMDEEGLSWEDSWRITTNSVAYTNHTILPEALERWSIPMFQELLPRIFLIVDEINRRWLEAVQQRFPGQEDKAREVAILWNNQVHMASLAVVGSHSVNGVAKLHSEILKINTLKPFYTWFPERFNNKTNGVTHRRWLIESNPQLTELICDTIGKDWIHAPEKLLALEPFGNDAAFRERLAEVKQKRKEILAEYLHKERNITLNPHSIFDIQIKRMHMYKRQLLNILHVYHLYRQLVENPGMDIIPRTFIFGGKAAASYGEAKITIQLINTVARLIDQDYRAARKLKVVFLENYNVSLGQKLFPAADVSEQISTASKEASGTGNMKFMFNGAITLGTMDGANVEIHQEVGDEHSVIFGLRADEVQRYYQEGGYSSWDIYNSDADVRRALEVLEENPMFGQLREALLDRNDEFFVLKDFKSYCAAQQEIERRYRDTEGWFRSSTVNIAHAGHFSSDRSIQEYADEIWNLDAVKI